MTRSENMMENNCTLKNWITVYQIFQLKRYVLWTKRAHQSTTFQTFECSNESSLNSSCHFWNHKVRVYSNFASHSVSWKKTPLDFCSSNLVYFGQKEIFRLFSGWVKTHQIPHVIFETKNQFFFKYFAPVFRVMRDNSSLHFLAKTLYYLDKRSPSKGKISDFWLLTWNFTKFVLWLAPFFESM